MKRFISKLGLTIIGASIIFPSSYFLYDAYRKSVSPSTFELAASKLGYNSYEKEGKSITAAQHQEALLTMLQLAGYFRAEKLWQTINGLKLENPEETFKQIYSIVKKSKADHDDPSQFNAKILRKNLGKNTELDEQNMMDFLLYTAQYAFGRSFGQEFNEVLSVNWMDKYKTQYMESAKIARLIDREKPIYDHYDEAWIAGASRIGLMARLIDMHYIKSLGLNVEGETFILTGERLLWANMDGILPITLQKLNEAYKNGENLDNTDVFLRVGSNEERSEEGKDYMLYLAKKFNIQLDLSLPFIEYKTKEDCPKNYFPGRIYPNYAHGEDRKLTETLMSQDLADNYSNGKSQNISVIDGLAQQHHRPTTASTACDIAKKLLSKIKEGSYGNENEIVILYLTNNPYIERQTLATKREVNKLVQDYNKKNDTNYTIKLDGVGFANKQDVATVHSEFAALMSEKWRDSTEHVDKINDLQFQTRINPSTNLPTPSVSDSEVSGNLLQDFFDDYL